MQKEFKMISFKKVDTLLAKEITTKHADLGPKPYYKFYAYGAMIEEVEYTQDNALLKKNLRERVESYEKQMNG
jgi:hypothetical protein